MPDNGGMKGVVLAACTGPRLVTVPVISATKLLEREGMLEVELETTVVLLLVLALAVATDLERLFEVTDDSAAETLE